MRTAVACLTTMLAVLLAPAAGAQSLFRWVDKEGKVHYSQQPPPKEDARTVEQRRFAGSVVEAANVPYALQLAMKNFPVTLFTAPSCQQGCSEARESLNQRGVPFREVAVMDETTTQQLRAATGGNRVPAVRIGSQTQLGFNADALGALLDSAGYPRTPGFVGKPPSLPPLAGTAGVTAPGAK